MFYDYRIVDAMNSENYIKSSLEVFRGAIFHKTANFYRAEFNGDAYFKSTKFEGLTSFKYAIFRGDAIFGDRISSKEDSLSSLLKNNELLSEESLADSIYGSREFLDPNSADIILLKRFEAKQSKLDLERMQNKLNGRIAIGNESLEDLFGVTCFLENVSFITLERGGSRIPRPSGRG